MPGFRDIVGHEQTTEHLRAAIAAGRVSHAYLIAGDEGIGKKTVARAFAMTLLCEKNGLRPEGPADAGELPDACGECSACRQVLSGNHPDLIVVSHEKENSISVDEIRQQVVEDVDIRPYRDGYKIYVIPDAEKMTVQAQNALLKTLEEPPAYAVLLLLTQNEEAMLETIRSRCVLLKLRPVRGEQVRGYLMKKLAVPDYQADIFEAFAQGNIGKAVKLATSESFGRVLELSENILLHVKEWSTADIMAAVKKLAEDKSSVQDFLDLAALWYRDVLYFKATRDPDGIVWRDRLREIRARASVSSYEGVQEIQAALNRAAVRLKANVNFELAMELLLLTMKDN